MKNENESFVISMIQTRTDKATKENFVVLKILNEDESKYIAIKLTAKELEGIIKKCQTLSTLISKY